MWNPGRFCALFAFALVFTAAAFAQAVNGTIVGNVTDSSGAAIPHAKVTITEVNTKIVHTGLCNQSGAYEFPEMPPGTYEVAVEMTGFKKQVRHGVVLEANTSPRADIRMEPGDVTQTIEVMATPAILQTDRTDTGRSMDAQIVEEMPIGVNRNFQSLLDLVPGTSVETFQHSQFFNASSSLQTNVNGQPRMGNNYQIEGIDNNERTGLLQVLITPAEAIQQVSVSTTNHDPELGRSTGAVVNLMIRSGTNNFHGAAYEFLQNSAFDARAFFNPSVGHLAYNYVGANLGGPLRHNKLFFFANYLRTMDHEANTNLVNLPSAAFHTGDLSSDLTGSTRHVVYDPDTGTTDGSGQNRTPFPNNILPPSRINPVSAKIAALIPVPNLPFNVLTQTNDYFALLPAQKTNDQVDSKIDWNISERDRLSGRFSFGRPFVFQAPIFGNIGGPAQGNFEGTGTQKTYSSGLNWNRTLSATLLTEVRLGVAHYHNEAFQSDYGKDDSSAIGIPGVNLGPFTSGFVGIRINGYSNPITGYSASLPWERAEANIDMVNTWTKILHNHQIKWGIDIRRVRDDLLQDQTYSPRGLIYFNDQQTGNQTCKTVSPASGCTGSSQGLANAMASFLLDVPGQEARDVNTYFPAFRQWQIFSYVADNWQVTPRVTVNLGVRWEIYTAPTPHFAGGFSNYDPATDSLHIAGVGGNPMNLGFNTRYRYFAPRLGIAYRLTGKTVLRSGFGVSYTPFPDNTWMFNFPVRSNNSYVAPTGSDNYAGAQLPGGIAPTFQNGFPAPAPVIVPPSGIIPNPDPTSAEVYVPTDYRNAYIEAWNIAVQRQLPLNFVIDVAYVGSHGVDTPASPNLNAGQIIGAGSAGQPFYARYGITSSVTQYFAGFSSTYNSLQVKFDRNFSRGFRMTTAFTWQKAMDFQNGDDGSLDFYAGQGIRRDYARADFDRTLNFVQSYIWQMPFGQGRPYLSHGLLSRIVGGWQLAAIPQWRTGTPLTFTGSNSLNLGSGGTTTDNLIAPIQVLGGINAGNPWFSIASFAKAPTNVQGVTGRNIWSGPNLFALNTNLSRTVKLRETMNVQLRLESLNVTNTPQFSNPNTSSIGTANFGLITGTLSSGTGVNGTGGGRVVQLGAKITW